MKIKMLFAVTILSLFILGCDSYEVEVEKGILKIFIAESNEIYSNGNRVSISEMDHQLNELYKNEGVVFYSKSIKIPTPENKSLKVMDLIIKYNLPTVYYTDKTFSTEGYPYSIEY